MFLLKDHRGCDGNFIVEIIRESVTVPHSIFGNREDIRHLNRVFKNRNIILASEKLHCNLLAGHGIRLGLFLLPVLSHEDYFML